MPALPRAGGSAAPLALLSIAPPGTGAGAAPQCGDSPAADDRGDEESVGDTAADEMEGQEEAQVDEEEEAVAAAGKLECCSCCAAAAATPPVPAPATLNPAPACAEHATDSAEDAAGGADAAAPWCGVADGTPCRRRSCATPSTTLCSASEWCACRAGSKLSTTHASAFVLDVIASTRLSASAAGPPVTSLATTLCSKLSRAHRRCRKRERPALLNKAVASLSSWTRKSIREHLEDQLHRNIKQFNHGRALRQPHVACGRAPLPRHVQFGLLTGGPTAQRGASCMAGTPPLVSGVVTTGSRGKGWRRFDFAREIFTPSQIA